MAKTIVLFILAQSVAHAEPRAVSLIAAGSCPSTDALRGAVRQAMPELEFVDADLAKSVIVVEDQGEQYRVRTPNGARVFTDAARRCDDRAKSAAVVIGLSLEVASSASTTNVAPSPSPPPRVISPPAVRVLPNVTPASVYPLSSINRPLILPPRMALIDIGLQLSDIAGSGDSSGTSDNTGETLTASFDVGIGHRLQTGLSLAVPIHPLANFGALVGNLQFAINRFANLRLDLGYLRMVGQISLDHAPPGAFLKNGSGSIFSNDSFVVGFGVPLKWKFHSMLALVSGSSRSRDFAQSQSYQYQGGVFPTGQWLTSIYYLEPASSSDLVAFGVFARSYYLVLSLPIGLQFQPHERVSFTFETGYRFALDITRAHSAPPEPWTTATHHYIPIGAELAISAASRLDLGLSFRILGPVGTTPIGPNFGYIDGRLFSFWLRARI